MRTGGAGKGPSWPQQMAVPRVRLGLMLVGLAVLFFGVNFCEKVVTSYQISQHVAALQQQIADANAQNAQLQQQIHYYQTPSYVIATARERYLYQHSGDTVFRIAGSQDSWSVPPLAPAASPPVRTAAPDEQPWWARLLRLFGN
ncbi:MAG: hypothetical protein NVSMB65_06930 [Chloroflexota bacterium]